jgi:hypothetical protein
MNADRARAVDLLVNYFAAIAEHAGMTWQPTYTAEIGEAVDAIIAATAQTIVDQARARRSADYTRPETEG